MLVPFDRVLQLDFGLRPGEPPEMSLVCEIQGRYSNAILTDSSRTVLLAARQIGAAQSSARAVRVGKQYLLPPPAPGVRPSAEEPIGVWRQNVTGAEDLAGGGADIIAALTRAYQGVSPALARDLCGAANVPQSAQSAALLDEEWAELFAMWQHWLACVDSGRLAMTQDRTTGASSFLGRFTSAVPSVHDAIDERYRAAQASERFAALHVSLQRAVSKAEKSLRAKLAAFAKQLASSAAADETQRLADLCLGNVYQWPAGAREMQVQDWQTGVPTLPPLLAPRSGANAT